MKLKFFNLEISLTAILLLISLIGGDLLAQPKGQLSGRVIDSGNGEPMPGVNIVLPGTYHGAASGLDGEFSIRGISAGEYTVRFQFIGFTTVEVTGVKIIAGLTRTLNAEMNQTVLAAGQEIVVIGKKPLFDIEETASRRAISADEIANSVVESMQDIVGNQVGVVMSDDEIHIRGGRSYENAYLLDGISVQDPLSGTGFGLQLSTNAIEEIEIITGGFAAEYGQAMSGIINVKTKQGTDIYHGSLSYKTDNFGLYDSSSQFNFNTDVVEMSIDGPDPFFGVLFPMLGFDLPGKQTFFANSYMFISDDFTKFSADTLISSTFHGIKYAPRQNNNWSAMLKYTWTITPKHRLQYSYNASVSINQNTQSLQSNLEYVPPGPGYPYRFQNNLNNFNTFTHLNRQTGLGWTHTLSSRTFYEVKLSNFFTNLRSDVNGKLWNEFIEPKDIVTFPIEYIDTDTNKILVFPGDGFYDFGNGNTWHDHWVDEYTLKADITHQKNERQEIKAGVEISYQEMQLFDILNPWEGPLGKNNDFYKVYPSFGGIYIQEKIVMQGLVANIGLRFDYWFPGTYVERAVADTNIVTISPGTRTAFENDTFGLFGRRWKGRISPRLGISHPVSDKQVLFFSYGHFSKRPKPQFVYAKLGKISSKTSSPVFGNPNLDPETTVSYELGVKNRFTEDDVLTITAFYKDIFDYITTVPVRGTGRFRKQTFITYLNLDYSRVRGIEMEYRTRAGIRLSGSVNGSYSISTGKSSSPDDAALVQRGDRPERRITEDFLIWDRPWQGSINFNYRISEGNNPKLFGIKLPDKWNVNFRYFAQAGKRYRPIVATGDSLPQNNRPIYTRDIDGDGYDDDIYANVAEHWAWANLNIEKWYNVGGKEFSIFLEVLNLFNRKNSNIINPVTGRAYEFGDPTPSSWNDPLYPDTQAPVSPFPFNPARYLNQRNLKVGVSFVW